MRETSSAGSETPPRYGVLVPVKPPAVAKSRLRELGDLLRRELVLAFALDTVEAAIASPSVAVVLAVTDDHLLALELTTVGAQVMPDGVTDDLNGTLVQAAQELHRRHPDLVTAALCADLPGLDPHELEQALRRGSRHPAAFLADAAGIGTTLVCAHAVQEFRPSFGAGSRAAHLEAGLREIDGADLPSVRNDVDTPADLGSALSGPLGPRTRRVARGLS